MSTPTITSRYPRPLKATQTFQHQAMPSSSSSLIKSQPSSPAYSTSGNSRNGFNPPPDLTSHLPVSDNRRDCQQPHPSSKEFVDRASLSSLLSMVAPRRANSLDSLDNASSYLSVAAWPSVSQKEDMWNECSHKRSNSCSSADRINNFQRHCSKTSHYSRKSVEGLNQEISAVLEGKSFDYVHSHPDGHIAPVHELLTQVSFQTPPTHSSPSLSLPSSPHELTPSPFQRDSPIIIDVYSSSHPPLPKAAFGREPPDSAEKCTIVQDNLCLSENYIPRAPDKSKANIVFKGTVFAPLLPSHNLKTVAII